MNANRMETQVLRRVTRTEDWQYALYYTFVLKDGKDRVDTDESLLEQPWKFGCLVHFIIVNKFIVPWN